MSISLGFGAFENCSNDLGIYVLASAESVEKYKTADVWGVLADKIQAIVEG